MSEAGDTETLARTLSLSGHDTGYGPRLWHAGATTVLFALATVEMLLGAWLIREHKFETITKRSFMLLTYIFFVSVWTMFWAVTFLSVPIGRPKRIVNGIRSVSGHFCFVAQLWAMWLAAGSALSSLLQDENCPDPGVASLNFLCGDLDILKSTLLRAFYAMAWVNFAWTTVLVIVVFIFGLTRLRKERHLSLFASDGTPCLSEAPTPSDTSRILGPSEASSSRHSNGGPSRIPDPGYGISRPAVALRLQSSSMVALLPSTQTVEYDSDEFEGEDSVFDHGPEGPNCD